MKSESFRSPYIAVGPPLPAGHHCADEELRLHQLMNGLCRSSHCIVCNDQLTTRGFSNMATRLGTKYQFLDIWKSKCDISSTWLVPGSRPDCCLNNCILSKGINISFLIS